MSVTPYVAPPQTTPWVPLWPLGGQTLGELAYAENPITATGTGTSEATASTVLTLPAVTLDGATPILVDVALQLVQHSVAGAYVPILLYDGATFVARFGNAYSPVANGGAAFRGTTRLTPSAGSHTYTIRVFGSTAGGYTVSGGLGGVGAFSPMFARITLASPISNAPAGAVLPVQYGTTLPVGPVDGQEAILVNSLTAADFIWRFRYNAQATGANKWEFVGGAPYALPPVGSTAIGTSYTTVGAGFTVPRSGDYLVTVGGQFGAGTLANAALSVSGGEASKIVAIGWVGTGSGAPWLSGTATYSYTAGDALLFRVNSSVAMNLVRGAYTITPLRVA